MKRLLRLPPRAVCWLALLGLAASAHAQALQDLTATLYSTNYGRGVNWSAQRASDVPVNGVVLNTLAATKPQFRAVVTYGAVVVPRPNPTLIAGNYSQNAVPLNLPRNSAVILRSATVGGATFGRLSAFQFGAVIPPPATDESGLLLQKPEEYWLAEPYTTNGHTDSPYYWSPHAKRVFATQPGPIQVTWRTARPGNFTTAGPGRVEIGGSYYGVTNVNYVVGGAAAKTPRQLYWTEKSFRATGKPVVVPAARVGAVYFHYNSAFPRTTTSEFVELGSSSVTDGSTNAVLQELRTAWYDNTQGLIQAYNREGRVFLELLGDPTAGEARRHLGYEILDVLKQPPPADLTAELGEKITAYADGQSDAHLLPEPVLTAVGGDFLHRDPLGRGGDGDYYAVKETANANDVLVHWLESGEAGLRWPAVFARYRQIWPEDPARYSHYLRPATATQSEAAKTAVPLPADNVPWLQYQDELGGAKQAFLNEKSEFYTWLKANQPVHRALLRFNSGEKVAFERVMSVLRTESLPAASVGTSSIDTVLAQDPRFLLSREGKFIANSWTSDVATTGIKKSDTGTTTLWAAKIGSTGSTDLNGVAIPGYLNTTTNSNFELSGTTAVYPSFHAGNRLYSTSEGQATAFLAGSFAYDGRPADVKLKGLVTGRKYVASFFSVGWYDPAGRNLTFASGGDSDLINQNAFGQGNGIRIDYLFTATETTRSIRISPVGDGAFHLHALSLAALSSGASPLALQPQTATTVNRGAFPRTIQKTVLVGERIESPEGELAASALAGYVLPASGTSFHPVAYKDPFASGFEAAKAGAIIPVNAIPGQAVLEVWWFRQNQTNAIKNQENGFKPIYWPAVLGRYNLAWPDDPANEIVMASNQGSGGLGSLQAKGSIYVQNDPSLPGYNPNEEHALMIGGQAYALRDDLNLTAAGSVGATTTPAVLTGTSATFSSRPYVLLDYTAEDGRPAVRAFKVLREKRSAGIVFDYVVEAGKQLQAPMPLPLLPAPVEILTAGTTKTATNYNREILPSVRDLPTGWTEGQSAGVYGHYDKFTYLDRKGAFWVMRGPHSGLPRLEAGRFDSTSRGSPFVGSVTSGGTLNSAFTNYIHTSRRIDSLVATVSPATPLPAGLKFGPLRDGLAVYGTLTAVTGTYTLIITDGDGSTATVTLTLSSTPSQQLALNLNDLLGRPPSLAHPASVGETIPTNAFGMRFFYKTQEGFAWPGRGTVPEVGTIVPYLRAANADPKSGGDSKAAEPLDIVYRPTWPGNAPAVDFGETLMEPNKGRPAIRGQTSAKLLYQQAIATNGVNNGEAGAAMILHDPTVQKTFALKADDSGLKQLPDGVRAELYQGKTYFPNLPPHLAKRFFLDPTVGPKGSLVFQGEFKDELFGEKYLLLNVLAGSDLATVQALCPAADSNKSKWDAAVTNLSAIVQTFYVNPEVPGQFIVNTKMTVTNRVSALVAITNDQTAVDSYALSAAGPGGGFVTLIVGNSGNTKQTPAGEPVSMYVLRVTGSLYRGELKILESENPLNELITFEHTADLGGKFAEYDYEWKIAPPVDGFPPATDATMSRYTALTNGVDIKRFTLGGSGIRTLVDNYLVMRYRPKDNKHPLKDRWSEWTKPQLAEGWVKRVLAKINPFNQRVTDLYNNSVSTDVSILTQAGKRYEGDIALNMENINNYGLIEIYETVLNRGRNLSVDAGVNFGPANDALLLAAGYINDLYLLVGNEAYADAANPTIGIGTKDREYGDIATALFAFRGQVPSLLEEELALLRGRDDVALPGVETAPVYNRLVWNFTRGIDAGEVIYALNYNILDQNTDGKADAADAAKLYPQGHGDAYGHYLTALKGYYSLLANPNFDWVPRVEAVTVLGQPVTVDYLDERKFAAGAAAVARAGRQIYDLTWRKDYVPGRTSGWEHFATNRVSTRTIRHGTATNNIVRHWGADHWASRTAQGAFLNWVVGNAILPEVDPDPSHEGIQKVDRTTVPELLELGTTLVDLQASVDNAEGRLTPLGLTEGSIPFDLNPNLLVGDEPQPHFEQVYNRAKLALNNALAAFDDAKDVTRLMRSEEDSLAELRTALAQEELAFTNALIEIYGTPYPDDVGPGKTYKQGYQGPDLIHYAYVETPELTFRNNLTPEADIEFRLDLQNLPAHWVVGTPNAPAAFDFFDLYDPGSKALDGEKDSNGNPYIGGKYLLFNLSPHGFKKPTTHQGKRGSPGEIQQAISDVIKARNTLAEAMAAGMTLKQKLNGQIRVFKAGQAAKDQVTGAQLGLSLAELAVDNVERYAQVVESITDSIKSGIKAQEEALREAFPRMLVAGLAAGGDLTSVARAATRAARGATETALTAGLVAKKSVVAAIKTAHEIAEVGVEFDRIRPVERTQERLAALVELDAAMRDLQDYPNVINRALQELDDAHRAVATLVARGDRIQVERQISRQRTAAVIQGFRTRDAAFRIFRNEKLERYKTLFDLASRYAFMAANAYDYETGLLGTSKGKAFVNRIVSSRALGVVRDGEPQFAGSNTGDPGLSSALAEMKADFEVLRGRLGFNAPDAYNTLASLRSGNLRILPTPTATDESYVTNVVALHGVTNVWRTTNNVAREDKGASAWQDFLHKNRMDNILDDTDVRRYCQQVDPGTGLPVPGIVITFSTSINPGENVFGKPLAAMDSSFHRSSYATKIHSVGVALEGYVGMNYPGKNKTSDPDLAFLDSKALSANPYVYLIPTGVDTMRSPPLGDPSELRTWKVDDIAIPLPFNIGGSGFSTKNFYQSADSLTEPLFTTRKHQAFRPTDSTAPFEADVYNTTSLQFSQFTNRRLVGRSVWNSQWKLVIPGDTLLADPKEGLSRLIQTLTDIKLYYTTYSYSGN